MDLLSGKLITTETLIAKAKKLAKEENMTFEAAFEFEKNWHDARHYHFISESELQMLLPRTQEQKAA